MPKPDTISTKRQIEKAYIVGVEFYNQEDLLPVEDSLDELDLLAKTAGIEVIGRTSQKLDHPNPKTFIGKGKVEEIASVAEEFQADIIIFDDELTPRHQRELETIFGDNVRVIDRTTLILDIFAQHASTREGSLQVELAQYEYRLPRLTRAWTHLARQAGGGGGRSGVGGVGLRGPGETQLEVDRRDIRRRISFLKNELEKVRAHRQRHRIRRQQSRIPVIALVGYTNAGKSTLLNCLTDANVYVADQLFATLDPTTRRVILPDGNPVLFTDTVGFIQKLPTTLVEAFRATLEEITEANLLLHIIDVNHVNVHSQAKAVYGTLEEIGADHIPVITVLNKIDCLSDPKSASISMEQFPNTVAISALKNIGTEGLLALIQGHLFENYIPIDIFLPYGEGSLISMFHEHGLINRIEHIDGGVSIIGKIPGRYVSLFSDFVNKKEDSKYS